MRDSFFDVETVPPENSIVCSKWISAARSDGILLRFFLMGTRSLELLL